MTHTARPSTRSRLAVANPVAAAACEPLEPRVLLAAEPLLAPLPQAILAHVGRNAAVVIDDIDGDGWNEILVGNAGVFTAGRSAGYTFGAFVISGRDGEILREHEVGSSTGVDTGDRFGASLAFLGDVDGDGAGDYAIGQPGGFSGGNVQRVHIFSGATGDTITILEPTDDAIVGFGTSLLTLGDVNGDGTPDLAVGASTFPGAPVADGAVFIYSGADWSVLDQVGGFGESLGRQLWDAGDLNDDGMTDFISATNRVFSGADGSLLLTIATGSITGAAGSGRIVPIADVDADGQHDFAASVIVGVGGALVVFSGADGSSIGVIATFDTAFGGIANIGDRNGDNFDEIALAISSSVQVRSSADGMLLQTIADPDVRFTTPGGHIGNSSYANVIEAGDVNNDGRTDLLVLTHMLAGFAEAGGPGRTDLFFGQDVGQGEPDLFDPDSLDADSELSVTSDDGLVIAGVNPFGDLIAFTRTAAGSPVQMHTLLEDGGVLTLDAFDDPRTGRLTIAVSTYDGLRLFAFVPGSNQWVETAIDTSEGRLTRLMQAFTFADGRIGLVGIGSSGTLGYIESIVLFEQSGGEWQFTNVTQNLSANGQIQPQLVEFTVYVAPWNAVHLTGRTDHGALVTIWRSHLTPGWLTTLIGEEVPEAQDLTNLSAFVAPWGGLHVAGVTPEGHVGVLWWSFELLETGWEYTDLTTAVNGPLFQQASIATYVTDWGGLNIAGVNTDGDLAAYWWVPGATWVGEVVAIDPGSMPLASPAAVLDAVFEPRHQGMRITARSETNEILLYTWRPDQGHTWLFENLSVSIA